MTSRNFSSSRKRLELRRERSAGCRATNAFTIQVLEGNKSCLNAGNLRLCRIVCRERHRNRRIVDRMTGGDVSRK